MFVRIVDLTGQVTYINPAQVIQVTISNSGNGACIVMADSSFIPVSVDQAEKVIYVAEKLKPQTGFSFN